MIGLKTKFLLNANFEFVEQLKPKEYLIVCGKRYNTLEEVYVNSTSKIIHKLCDTGYEV